MSDVKWECFSDPSYFDQWCVRRIGEREFGYGFHLPSRAEAMGLCGILNDYEAKLAKLAVPEGFVLVPNVPTLKMLDAGYDVQGTADHEDLRFAWTAMVAAAQDVVRKTGIVSNEEDKP